MVANVGMARPHSKFFSSLVDVHYTTQLAWPSNPKIFFNVFSYNRTAVNSSVVESSHSELQHKEQNLMLINNAKVKRKEEQMSWTVSHSVCTVVNNLIRNTWTVAYPAKEPSRRHPKKKMAPWNQVGKGTTQVEEAACSRLRGASLQRHLKNRAMANTEHGRQYWQDRVKSRCLAEKVAALLPVQLQSRSWASRPPRMGRPIAHHVMEPFFFFFFQLLPGERLHETCHGSCVPNKFAGHWTC